MGSTVRQLEIDWNGLLGAFQMNMPEVKCFLCLDDGKVVKVRPGDQMLAEVRADRDHYALIDAIPSRIQYQWLAGFITGVEDPDAKVKLDAAVNGKGAFRRFKDILLTLPDERRRWFEYRDLQMRQRVIEWIREQGIEPTNDPVWHAPEKKPQVNKPQDVEALRDFLIHWMEDRDAKWVTSPIGLEELAMAVGERFRVRPKDADRE